MPKIELECIHCFGRYDYNESTASTPETRTIYCSQACEVEEEEHLREGNKIIANALENNPLAFAHTISPLSGIINERTKETEPIVKLVDSVFAKFESSKKTQS